MFRPERMSRVSVTGSKQVMDDIVEAMHDLNLLHVTEYDGGWDGFQPGDPSNGADGSAEKLVTVRSLKSILDVDEADAGQPQLIEDDALAEELEPIRQTVNELDDRREELGDERRAVRDEIDSMEPFVDLGIRLDLLGGYETLAVAVGDGDATDVQQALDDSNLDQYGVLHEDGVVAIFARSDEESLQDVLVGTTFTELSIPDGEGDPQTHLTGLEERERELDDELESVEAELDDTRADVGSFLLSAEEKLAIDVQKREAPLTFATTPNAFVAEGWIPSEAYETFAHELQSTIGESIDVEELERARFDEYDYSDEPELTGGATPGEESVGSSSEDESATTSSVAYEEVDSQEAAADGGIVRMDDDQPPVVQDNPRPTNPFETLVEVINRPKYGELDPTIMVFLTFPFMFGLMIGDVGYGLIYAAAGWFMYTRFDSDVISGMGAIAVWSGAFTIFFGLLYGEIFQFHILSEIIWNGHPPIHKGIQPAFGEWALFWLVIALLFGILHVDIGYIFGFVNHLEHGLKEAYFEDGSWFLLLNGVWIWIFSTHLAGPKPDFLYTVFAGNPIALGFTGFSPQVGIVALVVAAIGFVSLIVSELPGPEAIGAVFESLQVLVNVLSYARLTAEILAEVAIAFAVNLLVFGAYSHDGKYHLLVGQSPAGVEHGEIMFSGLVNMFGIVGIVAGILLLIIGHLMVLLLGVISPGLQAIRLEYVEFFGKFYDGGGERYTPFGSERKLTVEE